MKLIAFIPSVRVARKILDHLALPASPLPLAQAQPPPRLSLDALDSCADPPWRDEVAA